LQSVSRQLSSPQCTFIGNSDLYGLGIRIGIYLQWISGLLANSTHADSVQDMLATNTIFLIALFTAMAIITAKDTVLAAEVTILLQFCFGFLFTVSLTWGLRVSARQLNSAKEYKKHVYFPLLGSIIRLCLATAICAYNVWFWFVGVGKLSEETCHPVGFLFAAVDLLRRARVFFKIVSVAALVFFGFATLSELVLLVCHCVFYSFIAGFIAVLLASHRGLQSDGTPKRNRVDRGAVENAKATSNVVKILGTLQVLMKYFAVVIGGIPWMMMNGDTGVGFKRLQSWVLIVIASVFIIFCLLIFFTIGVAAIGSCGSIVFNFFLEQLQALWGLCGVIRILDAIPWPRKGNTAAQSSLQRNPTPTPSAAQHPEAESGRKVVEGRAGSIEEAATIEQRPQEKLAEEKLDGEGLDGRRVDEEKLDEERLDGRRLDKEKLGPIETFRSVSPAEPAPNIKQSQVGPKKTGRLSKLALEFWKKLGDESDDEDHLSQTPPPQIPSWERWALPFINLVCVVWSILLVELTIKWNNITEVHTIQSVG